MTQRDARTLADGETLTADVCIVGGGAAGIAMALDLIGSGVRVALLESGGREFDAQTQELYDGENLGREYMALDATRLRFLGGSTNHWVGYCIPLDRRDLTVDPTPELSGWPLSVADLTANDARAHELCQLGPVDYRPETWARATGTSLLPLDAGSLTTRVLRRSPPTRFGTTYHDRITTSPDIEVYLNANVVEILTEGSRARGVRIAHFGGATQLVESEVVVLATGGIENPRLLLSSLDDRGRQLGNRFDLVGRCFMEHPHVTAGYLLADDELDLAFYADDLPVGDAFARGIFTLPEEVREAHRIGNLAAMIYPPPNVTEDEFAALPGAAGVRRLQRLTTPGGVTPYRLNLMAEQLPRRASRVRLSARRRDALGMPRAELHWQLDPQDERTLRVGTELVAAGLGAAGLGRVHSLLHQALPEIAVRGGNHHMGTTRMSEDPAQGVVDENGKVHDLEGLYIAGSSTFPTGGFANPTLTLLSLAVRLAAHLRQMA